MAMIHVPVQIAVPPSMSTSDPACSSPCHLLVLLLMVVYMLFYLMYVCYSMLMDD